jgi:cell division transport system permease protein
MKVWLRQHRDALSRAAAKLAAQKSAGLLSALVIGVALALPAGGYALLENLRAVAGRAAPEPQVSVFLRIDAARASADQLGARLKADPRIAQVRFVPREDALKALGETEGLAEVIGALDRNPLPDAFVVRARDSGADALDSLAADLRQLEAVGHVQVDAAWARRLGALAAIGRLGLALLAVLLAFGLVAVTFNTIRLQILTQIDEIEVSKLLGATDAFIRRPFYYLGLLQGLAGGVLSLGIVRGGLALLDTQVRVLADSYGSAFRLAPLASVDAAAVVAFATVLGWLGAYLSVSVHLRQIEPK